MVHTRENTHTTNKTLTACADGVGGGVRSCAAAPVVKRTPRRNVSYLNFSVMGEIAPLAILHSTDINRSSQDTQQLRASQTEPVRHGAGGGSTTRHSSFFFFSPFFFFFFYNGALAKAAVPKTTRLPARICIFKAELYIKLSADIAHHAALKGTIFCSRATCAR